jgi:hypothetical protein
MTGSRMEADEPRCGTGSAGSKRPKSVQSSTSLQPGKKGKKSGKSVIEFKPEHERKYGVRVSCRDSKSGKVTSAYCVFCVSFGREVEESRTRRIKEAGSSFRDHFAHATTSATIAFAIQKSGRHTAHWMKAIVTNS